MLRRSLFWGLTLMLVAVFVSLAVRSRHEEKNQAAKMIEIVKESKPTATRMLSPPDLTVAESSMKLETPEGKIPGQTGQSVTAHHQVVLRNTSKSEYVSVMLKFTYYGRGNKVLGSRSCAIDKPLPAGQAVSMGDISIEGVPASAASCAVQILYADFK